MRFFGKWAIRISGLKRSSKSRRRLFSASHFYSDWQTVSSVRWYTSPPSCRIFWETVLYFMHPPWQPLCWHSLFIWAITVSPSTPAVNLSWQNRSYMKPHKFQTWSKNRVCCPQPTLFGLIRKKTANKNAGITKQAADAIRQYRLIIPEKQPWSYRWSSGGTFYQSTAAIWNI